MAKRTKESNARNGNLKRLVQDSHDNIGGVGEQLGAGGGLSGAGGDAHGRHGDQETGGRGET